MVCIKLGLNSEMKQSRRYHMQAGNCLAQTLQCFLKTALGWIQNGIKPCIIGIFSKTAFWISNPARFPPRKTNRLREATGRRRSGPVAAAPWRVAARVPCADADGVQGSSAALNSRNFGSVRQCERVLPKGVALHRARIDAAGCQEKIISHFTSQGIGYAARADRGTGQVAAVAPCRTGRRMRKSGQQEPELARRPATPCRRAASPAGHW